MLSFIKTLLFFSLVILFYSCECVGNSPCSDNFQFRIVDKANGQDLVFGPTPTYNKDSVYLFTNLSGYTGPISKEINNEFYSELFMPADTLFLRLTSTDIDTIYLNYKYVKSQCCTYARKGYGVIKSIRFNNQIPVQDGLTYIFKK